MLLMKVKSTRICSVIVTYVVRYCHLTGNFRPGPLSGKNFQVALKYWFTFMESLLNPWHVFLVLINPLPCPLMDSAGCSGWRKESYLLLLPFSIFSVFPQAGGQHPSSNVLALQLVIKKLLTNCKITAVWLVAELMGFLWKTKVQRAFRQTHFGQDVTRLDNSQHLPEGCKHEKGEEISC